MRYDNQKILKDENGTRYLNRIEYPVIPVRDTDLFIQGQYGKRLDNLAFEYYGDTQLWWIIARANPDNQSNGGSIYMNPDKEALFGGVLGALIITGIKRGAFSNEAGIGTAPMAHGAAKTAEPVREGLVAMLGPFIDTIVVCTLTALTILVTGVWETRGSDGVTLTANAFSEAIPGVGQYILMVCIAVFSISSLFSYSYYGTKSLSFLVGFNFV